MSNKTITNQTIALAGIAQVCALVNQLAVKGTVEEQPFEISIASILKIDAESVTDVFGGLAGVSFGLQQLEMQLTGKTIANPQEARYAASLVYLEKQLSERLDMINAIQSGVEKAANQAEHFGLLHENVLAGLSELYHTTISTIPPRIMINGEPTYLSNLTIIHKIRSLLLAGIRSTMLWRQCGGTRWKFLLYRKKIQEEVKFLQAQL